MSTWHVRLNNLSGPRFLIQVFLYLFVYLHNLNICIGFVFFCDLAPQVESSEFIQCKEMTDQYLSNLEFSLPANAVYIFDSSAVGPPEGGVSAEGSRGQRHPHTAVNHHCIKIDNPVHVYTASKYVSCHKRLLPYYIFHIFSNFSNCHGCGVVLRVRCCHLIWFQPVSGRGLSTSLWWWRR